MKKTIREKLLEVLGDVDLFSISDGILLDLLISEIGKSKIRIKELENDVGVANAKLYQAHEDFKHQSYHSIYNHVSNHFFLGIEEDSNYLVAIDIKRGSIYVDLQQVKGKAKVHYKLQPVERGYIYDKKV